MALGDGSLRTKELTERVPGYTPRTIYRYAGRLSDLGVVEREEEPGVPSKVTYALTDSCGHELHDLVARFAEASLTRLPGGQLDAHAWASLGLLADLWETEIIEQLSCEARSPTQLSRDVSDLSYHQVNRRAGVFTASGLLFEAQGPGRSRLYGLTERTRRKMGLVAGIARWRQRHAFRDVALPLTTQELATILKVALPLVRISGHRGTCLQLRVFADNSVDDAPATLVWAEIEEDGTVQSCVDAPSDPTVWVSASINDWIAVILDRAHDGVQIEGEEELVSDVLVGLHDVLWNPQSL
jgi:DNA-binding HxlR family transcriptional regulator